MPPVGLLLGLVMIGIDHWVWRRQGERPPAWFPVAFFGAYFAIAFPVGKWWEERRILVAEQKDRLSR